MIEDDGSGVSVSNEIAAGTEGEFAQRVAAERENLVGFFRRRQPSADEAEDLAHDSQLAALAANRSGRYREEGKGRGFLYGIARRLLSKSFGREAWRLDPIEAVAEVAGRGNLENELALREQSRQLRQAVGRLSPRLREPIEILLNEDLSLAEIALRLGTTEAAIKVRIHRAKLKLRDELSAGGAPGLGRPGGTP